MGVLDGKVALISGVARGQGRSHAVRLAEQGADIIGVDICADIASIPYPMASPAELAETVEVIEKLDRRAVLRQADVRDDLGLVGDTAQPFNQLVIQLFRLLAAGK
jgi:NAD(P)-dependent dehydrogenase (short-subunit alcohol dehydrogenase family)